MQYKEGFEEAVFKLGAALSGCKDAEALYESHKTTLRAILKGFEINGITAAGGRIWPEEIAKILVASMTTGQKAIIQLILRNGNKATQQEIEQDLKAKGIEVAPGYSLAGITSGLTKKCNKYGISRFLSYKNGQYYISEEALPAIKNLL